MRVVLLAQLPHKMGKWKLLDQKICGFLVLFNFLGNVTVACSHLIWSYPCSVTFLSACIFRVLCPLLRG